MRHTALLLVMAGLALGDAPPARGSLAVLDQFDPSNTAGLCGAAFDPAQSRLWLHGCFGAGIDGYSPVGAFLSSLSRPGESANDVDLEVAPEALSFGGSQVPAGTLFLVNGETGVAEIHAIDPAGGIVLGTLVTAFGDAHVVGGAYHAGRNTFFLVQDRNPVAALRNRIAEIDPVSGAVLNSFSIEATFDVNYGDIDVCAASGNLLVVSSIESTIAEYTPAGAYVQEHALPVGVTGLSGIGQDDVSGDTWVAGFEGTVWRLGGLPCGLVSVDRDPVAGVALSLPWPNPSSGGVSIRLSLPGRANVSLRLYDVAGRRVRTLLEGMQVAGTHEWTWDRRDDAGRVVPPGVYWLEMRADGRALERRSLILQR